MQTYLIGDAPRREAFFGFDWAFALTDSKDFPQGANWRAVQLPHDFSIEYPVDESNPSCGSGGYFRTGIGWYKKSFRCHTRPEERVSLIFEGVYMNCDVYLNGHHVGGHVYGYTSFETDITRALKNGDNELYVRVDNSMQPNSRWYSGSGITRNVFLRATQNAHIAPWGVYVYTPEVTEEYADIAAEIELRGALDGMEVRLSILSPNGEAVSSASGPAASYVRRTLRVQSPERWRLYASRLYTLRTELVCGNEVIDSTDTRFGIRTLRFDREAGFFLNGEHVKIRGVCVHHDGGCVGAAVPPEIWDRRLDKFIEMGVNAIRSSHNPPDPALLDLCDEKGLLVMDEAFDEWRQMKFKSFGSNTHESRGYSEWFDACHEADLIGMLRRDRNHPCIFLWSIGNEVPEQVIPDGERLARKLADICRKYDPTRPVTQANDQIRAEPQRAREAFLSELDIVGLNYVDRWRMRAETHYDEEKRAHPEWTFIGTEHSAVGGLRGDYSIEWPESGAWYRAPYFANALKAERLMKFNESHDYVLGDFMWTGIDHLGESHWPAKSSSSGVLDTCGFEKDGYYFYQSQWRRDKAVLYLAPHLNLPLEDGRVYPVLCYTNCAEVELFVDGKSYGKAAYEFPAQGMTERFGHMDRPQAHITTNDLHLIWNVPYGANKIEAVGEGPNGEIARAQVLRAGKPYRLDARIDRTTLKADGRAVAQLEIRLLDLAGNVVPDGDRTVRISVDGPAELIGLDNGDPGSHEMFFEKERRTLAGLLYGVVRAGRTFGAVTILATADGLLPAEIVLTVE